MTDSAICTETLSHGSPVLRDRHFTVSCKTELHVNTASVFAGFPLFTGRTIQFQIDGNSILQDPACGLLV
ncbi:hypothetical protein B5X24_HaOG205874 [Helicoverpa armigera]|nr:hypothetical protein B5X24_HaOG205874 [Helicoverpa armigera]